jgi:hypothetical protein
MTDPARLSFTSLLSNSTPNGEGDSVVTDLRIAMGIVARYGVPAVQTVRRCLDAALPSCSPTAHGVVMLVIVDCCADEYRRAA